MQQTSNSFFAFVWKQPLGRKYLLSALLLSTILLTIFKYFYPYPDFISDSYSYIFGAEAHLNINVWPIGYSKFLALIHTLSHSDLFLIVIQYLLLQLSSLYFFFTLLFLYTPSPRTSLLLFLFLFVNPMFLFLSNLVNSDTLFAALTLLWVSELLWIIRRPGPAHLLATGILLFLCFTVRNNAYYYPFVGAAAFLLSRTRPLFKTSGIILPLLLILPFVLFTREAGYRLTGTRQFSLFTGWQLANNALYGYPYLQAPLQQMPTAAMRDLDSLTRQFFSKKNSDFPRTLSDYTGNFFITFPTSPLKQYFQSHYDVTTDRSIIQSWGKASTLYDGYGKRLIQQNPMGYFRGFILINLKDYLYPPLSNFAAFNRGQDNIWATGQDWFDWKTPDIKIASPNAEKYIVSIYPLLFLFLNVYTVGAVLLWLTRRRSNMQKGPRDLIIVSLVFLLMNFGFTIVATMNILRYQVVPMVLCLVSALAITHLLQLEKASIAPEKSLQENKAFNPSTI